MKWTEPLLDDGMISKKSGESDFLFEVHQPQYHSHIFKPSKPWDKFHWSTYFNVIPDPNKKNRLLMYYRGNIDSGRTDYHREYVCVLESLDGGYTFKYPQLHLVRFDRSKDAKGPEVNKKPKAKPNKKGNVEEAEAVEEAKKVANDKEIPANNIVWKHDAITHNFFALNGTGKEKDKCMYAIGGLFASSCRCCAKNVFLMKSHDGFSWGKVKSIIPQSLSAKQGYGTLFDSLNHLLYDPYREEYRIYFRYNFKRGIRCIQYAQSSDLLTWKEKCKPIKFSGIKNGHYYMPSLMIYPSSGYYLGFPCRQMKDSRTKQVLDMIFSRDGAHWSILKSRWLENQNKMDSPERFVPHVIPDGKKFLIYMNNAKKTMVELFTIRKDGFGSIMTNISKKEVWFMTEKLYIFGKPEININYQFLDKKTGKLIVEAYHNGQVISETRFHDHDQVCGRMMIPTKFVNTEITLKFRMTDCRLYSYDFTTDKTEMKIRHIKTSNYKSVADQDLIPDPSGNIKTDEAVKKKPKSVKKTAAISPKKVKIDTLENPDWKHLESINARLKKKPSKLILYTYFDLKNVNGSGSNREYSANGLVTEIKNPRYSGYNERGGGDNPKYGRKFSFDVIYKDGQTDQIDLIANSNSNARILFR